MQASLGHLKASHSRCPGVDLACSATNRPKYLTCDNTYRSLFVHITKATHLLRNEKKSICLTTKFVADRCCCRRSGVGRCFWFISSSAATACENGLR